MIDQMKMRTKLKAEDRAALKNLKKDQTIIILPAESLLSWTGHNIQKSERIIRRHSNFHSSDHQSHTKTRKSVSKKLSVISPRKVKLPTKTSGR